MPILETKNLKKRFDGVMAVNNLSLKLEPGKITGIIGPNGSGKSTLINLLTGMFPFDSGVIILSETTKLAKIEAHEVSDYGITRTFQDVRLFEQMPVIDNILVVLNSRNVLSSMFEKYKPFHLKQAEEVLRQVNLWEKRHELAANLSYGQRKLLEIARVLAMTAPGGKEVDIFFFDEPFAGLFPEMAKVVTQVLKHLREQGKTIILVEHNMDLIRELSDHVIVLDSGELLAEGEPEATLAKRAVVEAYLGE